MPPNDTNYLHFSRRRTAFARPPAFLWWNNGAAELWRCHKCSIRSRLGWNRLCSGRNAPVGVCLPFGGGWEIDTAAAAAVKDKSSRYGSSERPCKGKTCVSGDCGWLPSTNGCLQAVFANCVYPPVTSCATAMPRRCREHREEAKPVSDFRFFINLFSSGGFMKGSSSSGKTSALFFFFTQTKESQRKNSDFSTSAFFFWFTVYLDPTEMLQWCRIHV